MGFYFYYGLYLTISMTVIATRAKELGETSCTYYATKKVVCLENDLIINCQDGLVINFANAKFGKNEISHCPQYLGTETLNCNREKETLDVLNNYCSNQSSCDLKVTRERFGSPPECCGITNSLEVAYNCLPIKCQVNGLWIGDNKSIFTTQTDTTTAWNGGKDISRDCITTQTVLMVAGATVGIILIVVLLVITILKCKKRNTNTSEYCTTDYSTEMRATSQHVYADYRQL